MSMTESEISESAKRIAEAVMNGQYGSVVSEDELQYGAVKSPSLFVGKNRRIVMIAGGVILALGIVGGLSYLGYKEYKKKH